MADAVDRWIPTESLLPPEGVEVEVENGGRIQTLIYDRNLWWVRDKSMYVYFTPKRWRHKAA